MINKSEIEIILNGSLASNVVCHPFEFRPSLIAPTIEYLFNKINNVNYGEHDYGYILIGVREDYITNKYIAINLSSGYNIKDVVDKSISILFSNEKLNPLPEIECSIIEINGMNIYVIKIHKMNLKSKLDSTISWDEYFMNIAILASLRSKDITKVGSVLVLNKKVIGMGYNGFPSKIDESKLPTSRTGDLQNTKYAYTIHSEQNCILNTNIHDITGSTLYVTLFPCNECVKLLLQKGISEIVYLSDKHHDDPPYIASRRLLDLSNIIVRQYNGNVLIKND